MNEMTLPVPSRHRIRNYDGLRPSTLPHGHGGSPQIFTTLRHCVSLNARKGIEPMISEVYKKDQHVYGILIQ